MKFKTSVRCGGCVSTVSPLLDKLAGTDNWAINLEDVERTLSIYSDTLTADQVVEVMKQAGYTAELIS